MKKLALCLTSGVHQFEARVKFLHQSLMGLIILPAGVLFCLTMLGCDVQDGASVGVSQSQGSASHAVLTQDEAASYHENEQLKSRAFPRIVAFGDSLTAGLGVPPDDAYPGQLARLLRKRGLAYEVINAGVSGETSAGGLRRVGWILKSQPRVVILELGANDGLRGQPLKETYENLKAIIERFKAKGVIVIVAGMRLPPNYGDEYTLEFSGMYERLAREFDIPLIPFFLEGVATHRHLNQGDGIHPTVEGYTIVVQNVWRTLQPILKEWAYEG